MKFFFLLICLIPFLAQAQNIPSAPDYSNPEHWAALPNKKDNADRTPGDSIKDLQADAAADVFFIHPTTYTKKKINDLWNAPIDDAELNTKTDNGAILNQASIFNGAGRVFAPRYRQAHIKSYYPKEDDREAAKAAFVLAYADVKAAFEYYLEHYNDGRPIIIAAHSQGTTHGAPLIKAFFDGKPLQAKLVAAYLVGMPIPKDYFNNIPVCETEFDTSCFCSWRTFKEGALPKKHKEGNNFAVTNPLSWSTNTSLAPKVSNEGSVLYNFDKGLVKNLVGAKVNDGVLWVNKPKFRGSFFMWFKNYHIADYNFFYLSVRNNAIQRTSRFKDKKLEAFK